MKHILHKISIGILFLGLLGLSSACDRNSINILLTLDRTHVVGEQNEIFLLLEIDQDQPWTISTNSEATDWCYVYPPSGTGEAWITVIVSENEGEPRTATITARSGNSSASVQLTQQTMTLIEVVGNTNFSNSGATHTLQVQTNLSWTAEITEGSGFAQLGTVTSGTGSQAISVTFSANSGETARRANLRIVAGNQVVNLTLTQGQVFGNADRYVPFRIELPLVRDTTWFIQHDIGPMVNFALEYDTGQRHAFWVAYQLTTAHLIGNIDRDNFTFDPRIPRELQPHEVSGGEIRIPRYWSTYRYERGHILASADRTFSQVANDQTNFMSNISPHLPEFHNTHGGTGSGAGVWLRLENQVRTWARMQNIDTLYVVKGGSIVPGAPGTEIVEVLRRINRTVVPRYHFKAIVQRRGDSFYGIAFWLEQYRGMARRAPTRADAITIRELEQLTNIDFFPNLRIVGQQLGQPNLEDNVENTPINWSRWPGIN